MIKELKGIAINYVTGGQTGLHASSAPTCDVPAMATTPTNRYHHLLRHHNINFNFKLYFTAAAEAVITIITNHRIGFTLHAYLAAAAILFAVPYVVATKINQRL